MTLFYNNIKIQEGDIQLNQKLYEQQFSLQNNFEKGVDIRKTLVIASTPRCGSHFLGHALHQTGQFGFPLEYANPLNVERWKSIFNVKSFDKVLDGVKENRTSPNGIFSIKVHCSHLEQFGGFGGLISKVPNPHFILLTRRNLLKQAVSLSIARQTGVWISGQEAKSRDVSYNASDIEFCLKRTILHNAMWKFLLSSNSIPYIEVIFENARKDLNGTVRSIADFLNIDIVDEQLPGLPTTKKQSDSINEEWIQRYISEDVKSSFIDIENILEPKNFKKKGLTLLANVFRAR